MGDQNRGPPFTQRSEFREELELRRGVERRGGLVEMRICASRTYARARAIFRHSPPDRSTPPSNRRPSIWRRPPGTLLTTSWARHSTPRSGRACRHPADRSRRGRCSRARTCRPGARLARFEDLSAARSKQQAVEGTSRGAEVRSRSDVSSGSRSAYNVPPGRPSMDPKRRALLAAGGCGGGNGRRATRICAAGGRRGTGKFYEKGPVRIYYEEAGSGFPLLLLPGGGLNATIGFFTGNSPFNAIEEFKGEYRCITADLRNAPSGQSTGPVEVDRPWESYADDQLGLMDHLGIDKFMVMGFCIGGPFIWSLLKRAPNRIVAAVLAQPVGWRPEMRDPKYPGAFWKSWPAQIDRQAARDHDADGRPIRDQDVRDRPRLRLHRDTRFRARVARTRSWSCRTMSPRTLTPSPWSARCSRRKPK